MTFVALAMFFLGCAFGSYRAEQTSFERVLNFESKKDCEVTIAENKTAETSPPTAENNQIPGWKSIEVFYGKTQDSKQKRKWFSQSKQE
jgi:hypothetical protein